MRSPRATHNMIAVSANSRETAINTEQTLDTTLLSDIGDHLTVTPRREVNTDELTGREEPDTIYDNGATVEGNLTFNRLQPQHAGFLMAYGLGSCTSVAAGNGYLHTITPIDGDLDQYRSNPGFTAAMRLGKTIGKRRLASCFVESVTLGFNVDEWCKGSGAIKGTGKHTDTITEETVTALNNATSLPLAANAVHGATAAERLDAVQVVRALSGGGYKFCTVTAVSAATPAVITIDSLGGDGLSSLDYKIIYAPTEPVWATFPGRVLESPLRVSQMTLSLGGGWDGSAFVGGRALGAELRSLEYSLTNNQAVEFAPGAGGAYAGRVFREGRTQTIKLTREMRDWLLQRYIANNEYFGLHIVAEGAEFDTGHNFTVELIFPRLGLLSAPHSTDGKRLAEAGDLQVLQDAIYGSVICRVKNQVSAYAA